jgi:hypothetical protein
MKKKEKLKTLFEQIELELNRPCLGFIPFEVFYGFIVLRLSRQKQS